jgi:hypothetical protein
MELAEKKALTEIANILQNIALSLDSLELCLVDRKVLAPAEIDQYRAAAEPDVLTSLQTLRTAISSLQVG